MRLRRGLGGEKGEGGLRGLREGRGGKGRGGRGGDADMQFYHINDIRGFVVTNFLLGNNDIRQMELQTLNAIESCLKQPLQSIYGDKAFATSEKLPSKATSIRSIFSNKFHLWKYFITGTLKNKTYF